ncbi:MAG TPA: phosphopantetheine-binding protein [Terriglobales bacterium]|nr:phosphopantetheine-binding protein [Terriglobales bacterium]
MDDVREKLGRCFALAFPKLDPSQYATANAETVKEWDSIAQLTLLNLIAEEFEREIDLEEFEDATSFEALARALQVQ